MKRSHQCLEEEEDSAATHAQQAQQSAHSFANGLVGFGGPASSFPPPSAKRFRDGAELMSSSSSSRGEKRSRDECEETAGLDASSKRLRPCLEWESRQLPKRKLSEVGEPTFSPSKRPNPGALDASCWNCHEFWRIDPVGYTMALDLPNPPAPSPPPPPPISPVFQLPISMSGRFYETSAPLGAKRLRYEMSDSYLDPDEYSRQHARPKMMSPDHCGPLFLNSRKRTHGDNDAEFDQMRVSSRQRT
eukprot:gnl/Hemi2/846_TR305_c2_g1_i1.p1 gnl/Hemi2/846_TR305_c2_g1~~gnl/Hemi2/846_TR305_c2_g1_i1.p1  ORF type:complete len:246 (-),score=46.15 gnl/Hemi2/846_TR305_c2_g1_i1:297-1034(-)